MHQVATAARARSTRAEVKASGSASALLAPLMDQMPVIVSLMDASSNSAADPSAAARSSSSVVVLYQNKQSLQYYGRMMRDGEINAGGSVDSPTIPPSVDAMKHLLSLQQDPEGTLAVR